MRMQAREPEVTVTTPAAAAPICANLFFDHKAVGSSSRQATNPAKPRSVALPNVAPGRVSSAPPRGRRPAASATAMGARMSMLKHSPWTRYCLLFAAEEPPNTRVPTTSKPTYKSKTGRPSYRGHRPTKAANRSPELSAAMTHVPTMAAKMSTVGRPSLDVAGASRPRHNASNKMASFGKTNLKRPPGSMIKGVATNKVTLRSAIR